jgi:hypothetical protein
VNEWVWSIGGLILGKNEVLGEKPVTVPLCWQEQTCTVNFPEFSEVVFGTI